MEKRTLYALVLFLALGLGAFLVMRAPEKGDRSGPKPRPVPTIKAAEIEALDVTSEKQEAVSLAKDGANWRIKAPKDWPADAAGVKSLVDALEKLSFADIVTENKEKYDEMGVADGKSAHVVARGAGGKVLADLYIGKTIGGFTMLRPAGKNEVWQSTGLFNYLLNKDAKAWRDHVIFEFAANDGDKLGVESGANKLTLTKIVDEKNKGEAKWKIAEAAGDAPKTSDALDTGMVNGTVQALSTLRATDFADDRPASETGLAAPAVKVSVHAGAKDLKLLVGATKGDDIFVQAEGNPTIFTVKKYSLERVAHRPADYRDKTLAKIKEADLASVDLTVGTEAISLSHAGDKWKWAKPTDDAKVKPVVSAFENLVGASIAEEKDPAKTGLAKPAGTIVLHSKDKSTLTLKIGALSADKADYFVQKVGSPDVVMVKKYLVDRFLKKPADFAPAAKTAAATPAKKK
jgi:hypothetical protein